MRNISYRHPKSYFDKMHLYDFSCLNFESQSHVWLEAFSLRNFTTYAHLVVCMRKCTKHARYILKFREYLARAISPRPHRKRAAEGNAPRFSLLSFLFPRRNEFHANFAQHRPHNATRRLFAFAINYWVRAQL